MSSAADEDEAAEGPLEFSYAHPQFLICSYEDEMMIKNFKFSFSSFFFACLLLHLSPHRSCMNINKVYINKRATRQRRVFALKI